MYGIEKIVNNKNVVCQLLLGDVGMIRKYLQFFLLAICFIPFSILAYPLTLLPGGETIGIGIQTKGIIVAGIYDINGVYPATEAGMKPGDIIIAANEKNITTIDELVSLINGERSTTLHLTYLRNGKKYDTTLNLENSNGVIKTGLYVKDSITGIGTLSFIDPTTKKFGALGHEITEKNTGMLLEIKDGTIFSSNVTKIDRSSNGVPGSKNALFYSDDIKGTVNKNTHSGIFGVYTEELPDKKAYQVANVEDITLGEAKMLTVIEGQNIEEYNIEILKLNKKDDNKNILFEIVDDDLLAKTGGVVQGMSGSTIIQGDYIIGAVNYVVVDNPKSGYGIFITNMLKEMEGN